MSPQLTRCDREGAIYECSNNGWSNEKFFPEYLEHFDTKVDAVLLILDNLSSHIFININNVCKER